jgi:putative DNA methylase
LFAALVDVPGDDAIRGELLGLIKRLVQNGAEFPDEAAVEDARKVLEAQFPQGLPAVMDPFCGGGLVGLVNGRSDAAESAVY